MRPFQANQINQINLSVFTILTVTDVFKMTSTVELNKPKLQLKLLFLNFHFKGYRTFLFIFGKAPLNNSIGDLCTQNLI